MAKTYYDILGISSNASDEEIKRAYRRLAQKYHPDRNKENKQVEEKFKEINKAYQVLSDKSKKAQYDRFGEAEGGQGFQGQTGFDTGFDFETFGGSVADIFETFFGGGRTTTRSGYQQRGSDLETQLKISFGESIFGCEKNIELVKHIECKHCLGKGIKPESGFITCNVCKGSGQIRSVRNTILGQIATMRTCEQCRGEGKLPEKPCSFCSASGRIRGREKITVKIPEGLENGTTIRVSHKGDAGIKGGACGDLYLHVFVESSKKWQRKDKDLFGKVDIDLLQAILGDEIDVETVYGNVKLKIPTGTQSGQIFRIKGYGIPILHSKTKGDYLLTINVVIPKKISKKERELYAQLAEMKNLSLKQNKDWFF